MDKIKLIHWLNIAPNDIASMDILKDASATAICELQALMELLLLLLKEEIKEAIKLLTMVMHPYKYHQASWI